MTKETNTIPSKDPSLYSPSCESHCLDYIESLRSKMEDLLSDLVQAKLSASILKEEINNLKKGAKNQ